MTALLIVLLTGAAFSYLIYPLTIWLLNKVSGRARHVASAQAYSESTLPAVTLIITARNEEHRIAEKIRNTLLIDYPRDRLEVIVASDASDDRTETIAREVSPHVRIVRSPTRLGKEQAQLHAIKEAMGEICVFSDVATMIEQDGIRRLVAPFAHASVGATSSEDRFISRDGTVVGEGLYVRFEMWLRREEARFGSLVGLSGSLFAARRSICGDWDVAVPSDFNMALVCARRGMRAVVAPDAYGTYTDIKDEAREKQRKIRTVVRGITALLSRAAVLDPFRYGWFAYEIFGHKLMRWLAPFFLVALLAATTATAADSWLSRLLLLGQLLFYLAAMLPMLSPVMRNVGMLVPAHFFVMTNIAILRAWWLYLRGVRMQTWEPSRR